MNNKKMPYWLKGGVIGGGVLIVSYILSTSCLYLFTSSDSWGLECLLFSIPSIPIINILLSFPSSYSFSSLLIFSIELVIWFLIGSLIGAIVGYIKKK
ncbi:MAG: hypothetical protein NUV47_03585 [Patescibacteria group bacterium]|nr:hypothetical protein [Patescibacteria group bacterium]